MQSKIITYTLGSFFYGAIWLLHAFLVGMSHSVPYHKFDEPIYEYLFLIMIAEALFYLFLSHLFQHLKGGLGEAIPLIISIALCCSFPWQVIQFTQYGHGYRWLEYAGMNEILIVLLVNLLPLAIIILSTVYRERLGKLLFGRITGITK